MPLMSGPEAIATPADDVSVTRGTNATAPRETTSTQRRALRVPIRVRRQDQLGSDDLAEAASSLRVQFIRLRRLLGERAESAHHVVRLRLPALLPVDVVEDAKWRSLVSGLAGRVQRGEITESQRQAFCKIWSRAIADAPTVRRPSFGISADGALQLAWSFSDLPDRVLTVAIEKDGAIDWFFQDRLSGTSLGSGDELVHALPDEAFRKLSGHFGVRGRAR